MKSMSTRAILKRAALADAEGDGLTVLQEVRDCCREIDRLRRLIRRVRATQCAWGPSDDGSPEGLAFERACDALAGE